MVRTIFPKKDGRPIKTMVRTAFPKKDGRPMKTIFRAYKFRLQPTQQQEELIARHIGCARYVYNHFLNEREEQYRIDKKSDNYYTQSASLTKLKKEEETIWLTEVNRKSLQFALRCLDTAYVNFFRGNAKFPKFKSKKNNKQSFSIPEDAKLVDGRFYANKFREGIKVNIHREVKGKIGTCTVSKTPTGKYFVSVLTEQEIEQLPKTGKVCGIDLGLKDFAITSDGVKFKNNRYTKKYAKKLKRAQQHLSRKTKGSNSFEKQKRKTALIHEKIANTRQDVLHKVSNDIVSNYDVICLEDLNIKGMIKNRKLAKHISDASWGTFVGLLEYKADWNDKKVVKINRWYPSSKTCCECGYINQDLKLSDRKWVCKNGHKLDRDLNAAKNILNEGLKIYRQELAITKVERKSDFGNKAHSMKPEAHPIASGVGG